MGKRLCFMILAILLVSWGLYGCTETESGEYISEKKEDNSVPPPSENADSSTALPEQTNTGELTMIHYRVTDRVYHDGINSLCYPQITGLENLESEAACNAWIEKSVMQGIDSDRHSEVNYEVTSSTPELLSLLITKEQYSEESLEPQIDYYTLNLDVETGSVLTLSDFVDLQTLAQNLVAGKYTVSKDREAVSDYLSALSADTLAEEFKSYDFAEGHREPVGFSYIRSGKLHVLIPALPTLGGYLDLTVDCV